MAAAASFVYSSHIGLNVQLIILTIFGVLGTVCFCLIEWSHRRAAADQQETSPDSNATVKLNESHDKNGH